MTKQQPQRRDTYEKTCDKCGRTGYITKQNATTGNIYNEDCRPCQGKGYIVTPIGQ